ncbi:CaiB/BaiF CoA transferase family protein [Canibacter zhoujuaniae]|uniref:CaiB/BaiF CoA transferase family protein n=1 Tax=Canibacter zhoujuaniae TaxID=2708343 RepID=UPI00141DFB52|nr:CoA transferase [Canibacter zhoujuaniae]
MNSQSKPSSHGKGALAGVRVADFSRVLAGPYATMMLADLGADVIKIESPAGDGTRQWTPPVNKAGQATYFVSANRGKRSIALDLSNAADLKIARELAETADVVIENFKPGTMAKFGLDYKTLAAKNPRLVYASISGFGDGKGAGLPGYDLLVQAVGGLMSITGSPESEPNKVGVAMVDIITGLNAVIGIQAALRARDTAGSEVYGQGQHVKLSLLTSLLSALSNQASSTLETGTSPRRMGNAHPSIAPYETFAAADQTIALAVGTDAQFNRLVEVLGKPELASDERFKTNASRVAHRAELRLLLEGALLANTAEHWVSELEKQQVPAGRVNTVGQAFDYATALGLNPIASLTGIAPDGTAVEVPTVANPIHLSKTPASYHLAPPKLAEHQGCTWLDVE